VSAAVDRCAAVNVPVLGWHQPLLSSSLQDAGCPLSAVSPAASEAGAKVACVLLADLDTAKPELNANGCCAVPGAKRLG